MSVKPIPDTSPRVIPMLVCRNPEAEIEFCERVLHAEVGVRRPGPDEMRRIVMLACHLRPPSEGGSLTRVSQGTSSESIEAAMRAGHVYRRRLGLAWLFFLAVIAALMVAGVALGLFGEEDRCLDAGGVWQADEQRCEGAHPSG